MKIFTKEQKESRTVIRLFGHTIFRYGKKRRGLYDMKRILENYAGIETNVKRWEIQHGWMAAETVPAIDLERDIDLMLFWNKRLKSDWETKSKVKCEVITSPFVVYRRENNIVQSPEAKGTIAYPAHSTHKIKLEYDIDEYCEILRSLPEEFQPVTISLHHSDIEEYAMDKEYEKRGFKTVCASYNQGGKQFYEAFYDILKNYKYATSNEPGSYSFYAIEAGIPFFIAGNPSHFSNEDGEDKNCEAKKNMSVIDLKYGKYAYDLFSSGARGVITPEQKEFVESELGIKDGLSKEELKEVLKKVKK